MPVVTQVALCLPGPVIYFRVMASDRTKNPFSDSAIVLPRPTRPGSFTALMTLYESNFVRLSALLDGPLAEVRPRVPGTTSARGGAPSAPRDDDGMLCAAKSTA